MVWLVHLRGIQWKSIHGCLWLHCQAGRFDLVDSTAFMDVSCTLLYSETPPILVSGNRAICVHFQVLQFVVFVN